MFLQRHMLQKFASITRPSAQIKLARGTLQEGSWASVSEAAERAHKPSVGEPASL